MTADVYHKERDPGFDEGPPTTDIPATALSVVTPSDLVQLAVYARRLRIFVPTGTSGPTITFVPLKAVDDSKTVTFNLAIGVNWEDIAVRKVLNTGTTGGLVIHAVTDY